MRKNELLDASAYKFSGFYYRQQLEAILQECIGIYKEMVTARLRLCNNEERIRDEFMKYLKDDKYKSSHPPLDSYHFEKEADESKGRVDIKILHVSPYRGDKAYYVIECKRLDNRNLLGTSGLNAEYVKNGVCRFTMGYYLTHLSCNALLGFVVEPMDIDWNVKENLNQLLEQEFIHRQNEKCHARPLQKMTHLPLPSGYPYIYFSIHHLDNDDKTIVLYHLLLDFSSPILS